MVEKSGTCGLEKEFMLPRQLGLFPNYSTQKQEKTQEHKLLQQQELLAPYKND